MDASVFASPLAAPPPLQPDVLPLVPDFTIPPTLLALFPALDDLTAQQRRALSVAALGCFIILLVLARVIVNAWGGRDDGSGPKGTGQRTIVFCGPMGAGKTRVWARMAFGRESETITSMQEMRGVIEPNTAQVEKRDARQSISKRTVLVDTPGHPRLRGRALASTLPEASGAIFVLDTSTSLTGRAIRDAGDHLQLVLSSLHLLASQSLTSSSNRSARPIPLLILLTAPPHAAKPLASSVQIERARTALTRELARRRSLLPSAPGSLTASDGLSTRKGADISGLDVVPSAPSGGPHWLSFLTSIFGSSSSTSAVAQKEGPAGLPLDEAELSTRAAALGAETVGIEGEHAWRGGVRWAVRENVAPGGDGLGEVWEWVEVL